MASDPDRIASLRALRSGGKGGSILFGLPDGKEAEVDRLYRKDLARYGDFAFWKMGVGAYRPDKGLRLPQRRAIAFAQAYLAAHRAGAAEGEAALIKMPTGTGKSGVIAALACAAPEVRRVLILTPRKSLVAQMVDDVSIRFWRHLDAAFSDTGLVEGLSKEDLEQRGATCKGRSAPVRTLIAGQYKQIDQEKDRPRRIWAGTFNALHLLLGVAPPAHRSFYGRDPRPAAASLTQADKDGDALDLDAFRQLIRDVDLVIVDEGHHEPAYSWSQAVRELCKPTIIFTATPYRNDYKFFQITGRFVFNLSWAEAVDKRLIRTVDFAAPPASGAADAPYTAKTFVRDFAPCLAGLPAGKKAIIHAATFSTLKDIQRELFEQHGEAAVLIHDRVAQEKTGTPPDLARGSARMAGALKPLRFSDTRLAQRDKTGQTARLWLHQFKLLEGVDDPDFIEIWLYDGFGTARQLVQQVGRAIRLPAPDDPNGQRAVVRGSAKRLDVFAGAPTVAQRTRARWDAYLEFETYAAHSEGAFTSETQLLPTLKRASPGVQYVAGEFRKGHLLDETPAMTAFILPRRARISRVKGVEDAVRTPITPAFLDDLAEKAAEAMKLEERFDIVAVPSGGDPALEDMRMIRYLAWRNSPLLRTHQIPEWTLGVMVIVRAGRYIFLLDTEGVCIDHSRVGLTAPEPVELKRLFAAQSDPASSQKLRIVETTAKGLDVSELGLRAISVRRHSLDAGYFDLAEASQTPTSIQGYSPSGARVARRRLSLARSSVADATNQFVTVQDFVAWTHELATVMSDETVAPHAYFNRFAKEVPPLSREAGQPRSILLDLADLLPEDGTVQTEGWDHETLETLREADTCVSVDRQDDPDGSDPSFHFRFAGYDIEIEYIHRETVPPSGRYLLSSDLLNAAITDPATRGEEDGDDDEVETGAFGQRLAPSLTRLINKEQSFQIVTNAPGVVYSHGHFYRPDIDGALLSLLEGDPGVVGVVSEKGDTRVADPADWNDQTMFGRVETWSKSASAGLSGITRDLADCEVLVCDDSKTETADFYAIIPAQKRILLIHAKVADTRAPTASARKLQEVARQAQSSLALAGSSRQALPYPADWDGPWSVKLTDAGNAVETRDRVWKSGLTPANAHQRIVEALSDPQYKTEVVILTAGLLGRQAADTAFGRRGTADDQFLYYLASVRSTFDRAGVRLRIVCNP